MGGVIGLHSLVAGEVDEDGDDNNDNTSDSGSAIPDTFLQLSKHYSSEG